jgi:hypothetical protein
MTLGTAETGVKKCLNQFPGERIADYNASTAAVTFPACPGY